MRDIFLRVEKLSIIAEQREFLDIFNFPTDALAQVRIMPIDVEGIPARWFIPPNETGEAVVYYLHGGGYVFEHQQPDGLAAQVAQATRSRTLALSYRLAPEHPFPAAVEDAVAGYHFLIEQGINPARLAVAGDSAGGGLALAVLLSLREAKERLPALAILLSPWVDLSCQGESMIANKSYDYLTQQLLLQWARWYLGDGDPGDPLASPLNARLDGLPPLYIQAGGAEILIDQIKAFELQARADGARVRLDIWKNMNHDFQAFGNLIPECRQALEKIGEVFVQHIPAGPA
ncbi:MAG: alpha/beta hydrolase [Anaerolineae bacterium]|nr:alpha/beta hydrolase [Anaerolineae bacterium]